MTYLKPFVLPRGVLADWLGNARGQLVADAQANPNHPLRVAIRAGLIKDFPLYRGIGVAPGTPILGTRAGDTLPFTVCSFTKSLAVAENFADREIYSSWLSEKVIFTLRSGPVNGLDIDEALKIFGDERTLREVVISTPLHVTDVVKRDGFLHIGLEP